MDFYHQWKNGNWAVSLRRPSEKFTEDAARKWRPSRHRFDPQVVSCLHVLLVKERVLLQRLTNYWMVNSKSTVSQICQRNDE